MTALLAVICALNVGAVVLAWLALCRWRIRRRTRRLDALPHLRGGLYRGKVKSGT